MSDNGACIEKNGKEERALYLPAKELRELLYEARKLEGCRVMFSAVDGFYTDAKDKTFSEGVLGGYKGNKMWDIAKKYYTTIDNIVAVNGLNSDNIQQNDRLIIARMGKICKIME